MIEDYSNQKSPNDRAHPGYIISNRVSISKMIGEMVKEDASKFDHPSGVTLLDTFKAFDDSLRGAFADISAEKHRLNVAMNAKAISDVREIKALKFLDWAVNLVSNLPPLPQGSREDRSNGARWKFIAIAIMILTGRRQSEVMSSGIFRLKDNSSLVFEGQLKRHIDEIVDAREIPVLCGVAKEVVSAIRWLEAYGKRSIPQSRDMDGLQSAAKKSHDLCSRYISEAMGDLECLVPIVNGKSWSFVEDGKIKSKFKGHLCRQLYAEIAAIFYHDDSESKKRAYITEILGESSASASLPYDRDVKIADAQEIKEKYS